MAPNPLPSPPNSQLEMNIPHPLIQPPIGETHDEETHTHPSIIVISSSSSRQKQTQKIHSTDEHIFS
jgi:hypothetical protein